MHVSEYCSTHRSYAHILSLDLTQLKEVKLSTTSLSWSGLLRMIKHLPVVNSVSSLLVQNSQRALRGALARWTLEGGDFCGCDLGLSRSGFPSVPQQASHASPHCVSGSPPQRRAWWTSGDTPWMSRTAPWKSKAVRIRPCLPSSCLLCLVFFAVVS